MDFRQIDNNTAKRLLAVGSTIFGQGETSIKNLVGSLECMNQQQFEELLEGEKLEAIKRIENKTSYVINNKLGNFVLLVDNDYKGCKKDNKYIQLYKVNKIS